jgi:hypothetical protein
MHNVRAVFRCDITWIRIFLLFSQHEGKQSGEGPGFRIYDLLVLSDHLRPSRSVGKLGQRLHRLFWLEPPLGIGAAHAGRARLRAVELVQSPKELLVAGEREHEVPVDLGVELVAVRRDPLGRAAAARGDGRLDGVSGRVQDRANGRRTRNVRRPDEEAVRAGGDAQAEAFADTARHQVSNYEGTAWKGAANLSKMWFCASAAWRRAHWRSEEFSAGPFQNRQTIDASRSSMYDPGVRSVNCGRSSVTQGLHVMKTDHLRSAGFPCKSSSKRDRSWPPCFATRPSGRDAGWA